MVALAACLKYWREIALGLIVLVLVGAGLYIRSVFAERDQLKQDKAVLAEQVKSAAAMQEMTNKIADAISQIKVRSQVNVSRIESEPKPVFVDSRPLRFISGGMLQAVYSSGLGASAARAAPGPAPGGPLPAGKPAVGILSR
jgi:hypothetical protein